MHAKSKAALCAHPRLLPFAEMFIKEIQTADPVASAQCLAQMSASWTNARQRRRALAARIALLSAPMASSVAEQLNEIEDEIVDRQPAGSDPEPEHEPRAFSLPLPKQRKAAKPSLDMKHAASMFEAMNSSDDSSLSNPDFDDGNGMSLSAPDQGSFGRSGLDFEFPPDGDQKHINQRQMPDWPEPAIKEAETENHLADPQKPTMMDLSLSLLTGSFAGPSASENISAEEVNEATLETVSDEGIQISGDGAEDQMANELGGFVPDERTQKKKKPVKRPKSSDLSALDALTQVESIGEEDAASSNEGSSDEDFPKA